MWKKNAPLCWLQFQHLLTVPRVSVNGSILFPLLLTVLERKYQCWGSSRDFQWESLSRFILIVSLEIWVYWKGEARRWGYWLSTQECKHKFNHKQLWNIAFFRQRGTMERVTFPSCQEKSRSKSCRMPENFTGVKHLSEQLKWIINNYSSSLKWALSQQPTRPKADWAID